MKAVVLDLLYVIVGPQKPILWQISHFKVCFQASVLGLQGAKMAPQIFMSNFLPSKEVEMEACGTALSPHFVHSGVDE